MDYELTSLDEQEISKEKGRKIAAIIIDILESNKAILSRELSGRERFELGKIWQDLKWGRTGKWKRPTTTWNRFGQFNHIIFQLPGNHGNWRFKYEKKTTLVQNKKLNLSSE